jgi:hypothetical protein
VFTLTRVSYVDYLNWIMCKLSFCSLDICKNYGAFLEKDGAGFRGQVKLTGLSNGDTDLTNSLWTYQVNVTTVSTVVIQMLLVSFCSLVYIHNVYLQATLWI